MSNSYETSVQFDLRPSLILLAVTLISGLGAALILLFSPLSIFWQGLGLVAVASLSIESLVSGFGRRAVVSLRLDRQGVCTLSRHDGTWQCLRPQWAIVHSRWVKLTLEHSDGRGIEHLLIAFDALPAESFRRLRASLNQWDWQV